MILYKILLAQKEKKRPEFQLKAVSTTLGEHSEMPGSIEHSLTTGSSITVDLF